MLPKRRRVTKKLLEQTLKEGSVLHSPSFIFRFKKESPDKYSHFAFIVPKTVSKSAVERNKMRRKGYNIVRKMSINKGYGLFFYKKGSQKSTIEELNNEIKGLISKANL